MYNNNIMDKKRCRDIWHFMLGINIFGYYIISLFLDLKVPQLISRKFDLQVVNIPDEPLYTLPIHIISMRLLNLYHMKTCVSKHIKYSLGRKDYRSDFKSFAKLFFKLCWCWQYTNCCCYFVAFFCCCCFRCLLFDLFLGKLRKIISDNVADCVSTSRTTKYTTQTKFMLRK